MNLVAAASTSLVEATNFLTRPLSPIIPYSTFNTLQQILLSTFISLPAWRRDACLTLTFTSSLPPPVISSVCIATRVDWSDWYYALGGRGFDLTIERTSVSLQAVGISGRVVIWKDTPASSPTILPPVPVLKPEPRFLTPTNTFSHLIRPGPPLNGDPKPAATRTQYRTTAQELLQSEHEMEEANEIFAMISKFNSISTTFNTERYTVPSTLPLPRLPTLSSVDEKLFHSQFTPTVPSPISSPESSRSNSPSSTFSAYSSQESLTDVSVISFPPTSLTKITTPPASVSKCAPSYTCNGTISQAVTVTKSQVQRYLYQGGQSTILTGGVMLGNTTNVPTRRLGSKMPPPRMRYSASHCGLWKDSVATHV